jgi:hypothetical protein
MVGQDMPQSPLNEHLPLAVAAAITYHNLTAPQRPQFYDGEHLSEVLTRVAQALVQVTRVYVLDEATQERRPLTDGEQAEVRRGATVVLLADGRRLTEVTILRRDLRDAIAALRARGFAVTRPS